MPSKTKAHLEFDAALPLHARITIRIREAAAYSGLSVTTIQQLVASGVLESIKVGRLRLIRVPSFLKLLDDPEPYRNGRPVVTAQPRRVVRRMRAKPLRPLSRDAHG